MGAYDGNFSKFSLACLGSKAKWNRLIIIIIETIQLQEEDKQVYSILDYYDIKTVCVLVDSTALFLFWDKSLAENVFFYLNVNFIKQYE